MRSELGVWIRLGAQVEGRRQVRGAEDDISGIIRAWLVFRVSRLRPPWELVQPEKKTQDVAGVPQH